MRSACCSMSPGRFLHSSRNVSQARATSSYARLFSDAKAGKNTAEEIVSCKFSRHFAERLLGAAQLFGDELAGATFFQLTSRFVHASAGALERVEMTSPRRDRAGVDRRESHGRFEMLAQRVEPLAL